MPQFTKEETKAERKLSKMKLVSGEPRVQTWTFMAIINYTTLPLNTYWLSNIYNLLSPYQMFSDGLNSLDYFIQMSQNSESSFYQEGIHTMRSFKKLAKLSHMCNSRRVRIWTLIWLQSSCCLKLLYFTSL